MTRFSIDPNGEYELQCENVHDGVNRDCLLIRRVAKQPQGNAKIAKSISIALWGRDCANVETDAIAVKMTLDAVDAKIVASSEKLEKHIKRIEAYIQTLVGQCTPELKNKVAALEANYSTLQRDYSKAVTTAVEGRMLAQHLELRVSGMEKKSEREFQRHKEFHRGERSDL